MGGKSIAAIEERLQAVEDGTHAVGDIGAFEGREHIAAITRDEGHLALVAAGCAHMSSLPYVVIEGNRAVATCHTMVPTHGENGFFIGRLSASSWRARRRAAGKSSTGKITCWTVTRSAQNCWVV